MPLHQYGLHSDSHTEAWTSVCKIHIQTGTCLLELGIEMGCIDMTDLSNSKKASPTTPMNPLIAGGIVGVIAVLMPFIIQINETGPITDITIAAAAWMYQRSSYHTGFRLFRPDEWLFSVPFTLPRLIFSYQVMRYYKGKSSRVNTAIVGFFCETPVLLFTASVYIISFMSSPLFIPLLIPLPVLLVIGLLLMWRRPMIQPTTPWD